MKKIIFVLLFLFLLFIAGDSYRYKYYDIFKWVAEQKRIVIDKNKPYPAFILLGDNELQESYHNILILELSKVEKINSEIISYIQNNKRKVDGFYYKRNNIVFLGLNKIDGILIAHEIVHYFQNFYSKVGDVAIEEFEAVIISENYVKEKNIKGRM